MKVNWNDHCSFCRQEVDFIEGEFSGRVKNSYSVSCECCFGAGANKEDAVKGYLKSQKDFKKKLLDVYPHIESWEHFEDDPTKEEEDVYQKLLDRASFDKDGNQVDFTEW